MKVVVVYSVIHTGTWFTLEFLDECCQDNSYIYHRGQTFRFEKHICDGPMSLEWLEESGALFRLSRMRNTPETLLIQAHHIAQSAAPVLVSLKEHVPVPDIRFVIPMRDPLLSINSRLWRHYLNEASLAEAEEARAQRVEKHFTNLKDLLSLSADRAFILPVDLLGQADDETREEAVRNLFSFCNLTVDEDALASRLENWSPVNVTGVDKKFLTRRRNRRRRVERGEMDTEFFNGLKRAIKERDEEHLEKYISVELNYLKEHANEIKPQLMALGYDNLVWW